MHGHKIMELALAINAPSFNIEEVIQDANMAQNSDDLALAEKLYLQVLTENPQHPDANHNLGILYLSINWFEKALPLLRTALEAHPDLEHFWISYFHGLTLNHKFEEGHAILKAGKENGLDYNTLVRLEEILSNAMEEL